jgi:hypothetical protein
MTTTVTIKAGHRGAVVFVQSEATFKQDGWTTEHYSSTTTTLPPSGEFQAVVTDMQECHVSEPLEDIDHG